MKWDKRFMEMAKLVSTWSKDPSTQVGAVITRGKKVVSVGFNGFAAGVGDDADRYEDSDFKYPAVIHAEENAILFSKQDLSGCSIYVYPMPPCARCAAKIIQVGITRITTIKPAEDKFERWEKDFEIAEVMYADFNIKLNYFKEKL